MGALVTVEAVPIARVGVWETSSGRWVCTPGQLQDAVRASKDPAFRKGVLKLGHTDPRFDGQPAVGRLDNYRVDASGEVLLADLVGVPAWLKEVMTSAYPSRSVEAQMGVVTASGDAYGLVITGLALLGETAPAIASLADVAALFEQSTAVEDWVAARALAASIDTTGAVMATTTTCRNTEPHSPHDHRGFASVNGEPPAHCPGIPAAVLASATIDDLVQAATQYAAANGLEYPWVREVYTDKVIVGSDTGPAGRFWELEWAEGGGDGAGFAFTGPYPVKIEYTRLANTPVAAAAHRTIVPVRYVRGRGDVTPSLPEEHPPVSDLATQVRERLGLPPDATDEQVTAALEARLGTAAPPPAPPTPAPPAPADQGSAPAADTPTAGPPATSVVPDPAALERLVSERVAAAVAPFKLELERTSGELAARKESERGTRRDTLLASAVSTGKITPAERDKWAGLYDKSPDSAAAVEQVFASLAAGTAVPTAATDGAHTGGAEPSGDGFTDAEYASLFGPETQPKGVDA